MKSNAPSLPAAGLSLLFAAFFFSPAGTVHAAYERINQANPLDPMDVAIYRLDNGLTVYLTENHDKPRFHAEIAVRAGSKHDPAETTGLAHYLEHLLFKGNESLGTLDYAEEHEHIEQIAQLYEEHFAETDPEKRAEIWSRIVRASQEAARYAIPNELDRIYSALGAENLNAHTWHEETVYKVDLPGNRLKQWALIESARFINPVFRLFQSELETVYEEMNRALDDKNFIISTAVDELLFKTHPYGQQPTIGLPEHLKNPSLEKIAQFYNRYYVPNNMALILSGDINQQETIKLIDEHFSRWKQRELPDPPEFEEEPLQGREFVETTYQGEEYLMLAFRTAARTSPDAEPLMLFDMILDNATAGLINLNLEQTQKVRGAGSMPQFHNDYGAQYLWGVPKEGQSLQEVEKLLLEQVELVKEGNFDDWLLSAIINDFKKSIKAGLENNSSRVAMIRDSFIAQQDWDDAVAKISRMEKLTKKDVVRVANRYFDDDYVAGFRRDAPHQLPEMAKPELASVEIDPSLQSEFAEKILSLPVDPIEPEWVDTEDYSKGELAPGINWYYTSNPINDLFAFSITIDIGMEANNKLGLASRLLEKSGTDRLSAEQLKKEWYKLGTDFAMSSGENETVIRLTGLDENLDASLDLLMEVLHRPAADEQTLDILKTIVLQQRADAMKQAPYIMQALTEYHRYGKESFFLRMLPKEALLKLKREELFDLVGTLLDYKHRIHYTGSLPEEKVKQLVRKHHPLPDSLQEPPPYRFRTVKAPDQDQIFLVHKPMAQSQIRIEFGSVDYQSQLTPEVQLFNNYFSGGMAGIVFQELREARALAYSVFAHYVQGSRLKDQNIMLGMIGTQRDKTPEATRAFLALMDALPESESRFSMAKQSIIQDYRTGKLGFREIIPAIRSWEEHDLKPDPRREWFKEIQDKDLTAVVAFHNEYIKGKPKLISIVGDSSRMNTNKLADIAPITNLEVEQLFIE